MFLVLKVSVLPFYICTSHQPCYFRLNRFSGICTVFYFSLRPLFGTIVLTRFKEVKSPLQKPRHERGKRISGSLCDEIFKSCIAFYDIDSYVIDISRTDFLCPSRKNLKEC